VVKLSAPFYGIRSFIGLETHVQLKTIQNCGAVRERVRFTAEHQRLPHLPRHARRAARRQRRALRLTVSPVYLLNSKSRARQVTTGKNNFYPDASKITSHAVRQAIHANGFGGFDFKRGTSASDHRAHLEEDVGKSSLFERTSGVISTRAGRAVARNRFGTRLTSADMAYDI